ncbi:MAG TPA: lasso peptide biosynthesis B2 protein [Amycolatopsis sp.]|uniref:lasso peptide biosynthesis B2 protein n=1 Tax=Amycolatopsis sp. TaxID=37632 RepID=UPI002B4A5C2F|nr:lasso peptide biosynthesis B2 protein [Amycolatopsis sp.]HKS44725.1 lasso peptide biosynthesis B2 protein [Amycolatopsis sp.]
MSAPIVLEAPVPLGVRERLRGLAAVGTARVILTATRGHPARIRAVLRILRTGASPADLAAAVRARGCVTTVSLRCASDHGCLLRSVAIVVACRLAGRTVVWRVGTVSPPPSSHAWVEAAGVPAGEPFDPRLLYSPIMTV